MSDLFYVILKQQFPGYEREYRFHPKRRWRFDHAWPHAKIALECEGGIWTGGRHTRAKGFLGDIEKYNEAGILGWRVFRITPKEIKNGQALELLERIFQTRVEQKAAKYRK